MSKLIYGSVEVNLEGTSAANALSVLKTMYPELANATLTENANHDFVATVATATKGAGEVYAIYGETKIAMSPAANIEVVKSTLQSIYPELANASVSINDDGNFVFTVATATKGAEVYAIYGDTKILMGDVTSIEVVKSTLQSIYPELSNATVSRDANGNFVFTVATATKGN